MYIKGYREEDNLIIPWLSEFLNEEKNWISNFSFQHFWRQLDRRRENTCQRNMSYVLRKLDIPIYVDCALG